MTDSPDQPGRPCEHCGRVLRDVDLDRTAYCCATSRGYWEEGA